MSTTTTTKAVAATALGGLLIAAVAWTQTHTDMPVEPETAPSAATAVAAAAKFEPDAAAPTAMDRRKQWEEVRRAIASRRSQQPQPGSEPSVLGDQSHEDVLAEMGDELAKFEALGPVLSAVFDQGVPLFVECLETLPETSTGKLHLRADVIGEPDLGAIVETVEVVDDSLDQPAFEECLRESAYAIALDAIGQPISKSLDITVDMEDRSLSINAGLDLEHFTDMPTRDPELWAELLADPKGVENLAELLKIPDLGAQHPEFVAAIEAALAASKPAE